MEHTLAEHRFLPIAFHLVVQCIGPIPHEGGTVVDPKEVLINTPVLSMSMPLGLVYWSAIRASWAVRCTHKFLALAGPTSGTCGLRVCLDGKNTLAPPSQRVTLLLHAFKTMDASIVLEHPRVRVASNMPLPTLHQPARKKKKKVCTGSKVGRAIRVYCTQSCGG